MEPLKPSTGGEPYEPHVWNWTIPLGTEAEEEQSGLLKYLLMQLGDWLVEEIIRPALEGAVWLINWIRAELRYWTYEAMKWIAEITSTTEGMIIMLAVTFGLAITIPQLATKFASSSIGIMLKKLVDWTKEKVGNISVAIHFVDLIKIHEVLLVIWPKWREVFAPFQDAISALSEQLGQGTGYIHAWLSVTHALSMVGTSLLNIDPEIGEIRAFETSQTFMEKLDARFRAYAHDPGLIAQDIIEEIYIPYANEIRDTQTGTIESIKDSREYMLNLNGSLQALDDSFEYLIASTLPDFQEQMSENVKGIREVINQYSTWIEEVVLPPMDASIQALEERADIIERSNAIARAKLDNPIEIFMATEFQDEETQLATWNYLKTQLGTIDDQELENRLQVFDVLSEAMIEATKELYLERPSVVQPPRAALSLELPTVPALGTVPPWYRGED